MKTIVLNCKFFDSQPFLCCVLILNVLCRRFHAKKNTKQLFEKGIVVKKGGTFNTY